MPDRRLHGPAASPARTRHPEHDPSAGDLPQGVRARLPVLAPSPGRLAAERALLADAEKKEKCGVFGVWGEPEPANLVYVGLYALQHRGQESAGVAVADADGGLRAHTGMGLVPEVFTARLLKELAGDLVKGGIGHNRYSTAGGSLACNAQPILENFIGGQVALAHNGNLTNAEALRRFYEEAGHIFHTQSDSEVFVHLLASPRQQKSPDPVVATLRRVQGAFSVLFLFKDRIEAARDPHGWRPLVLGKTQSGNPVVASETVALDAINAKFVREVEPGEIVTLSDEGVTSRRFAEPAPRMAHCVFEHVYFASPSSVVFGQTVQLVRERFGEQLAREAPAPGRPDYIMPMPDSGRSAASGYARASGVPYREGIVPNRYVGRTFIKPTQRERAAAVRLKLNVIDEIVRDKSLVVVDDSIVRGTTTRAKMEQLRAAGAREIHLRISCPPIRHPCFFGVDFPSREQLVAHERTVEDIRAMLGVDTLAFLSLEGMLEVAGTPAVPADQYCTACWSGEYRIDIEHPHVLDAIEPGQMSLL
ncbi:MAG: amidophosphoribosyltransferase [Phycisphaerales bacterium]